MATWKPDPVPASKLIRSQDSGLEQWQVEKELRQAYSLMQLIRNENPSALGGAKNSARARNPEWLNWVTSGETGSNFITDTNEKISSLAIKETNVSVYPIGTLIVAMYGQGKTRGQISELSIEAGTNQACAAIVLVDQNISHRRYLSTSLRRHMRKLEVTLLGGRSQI